MSTFTADRSAALGGPAWLRRRRAAASEELAVMPMPSEKEEVWRYTPIDELRLDEYAPSDGTELGALGSAFLDGVVADLPVRGALVTAVDGRPIAVETPGVPEQVRVGGLDVLGDEEGVLGRVLEGGDALVRLSDAFHRDVVVIDVPARVVLDAPIVVVHWCTTAGEPLDADGADATSEGMRGVEGVSPASFPRTVVRLGAGSSAQVVEIVAAAPGSGRGLVVPVTELSAGDGAQLSYAALQVLGAGAWHLSRLAAVAGRDATLRTFTVGLGGAYDRSRTDALADGPGSTTELRSAYLGTGTQVHDVRTLQDHAAPHTTSDLLCKGAVAGSSRSVYSGLIRVRRGAIRTNAFQTNQNLVLGDGAHADSVPNLDIQENDVRCSHASTVGPVDEDQRYYLESRGIPPARAEQLIVLGFFDDIVQRSPVPALAPRLRREVGLRLAGTLELDLTAVELEGAAAGLPGLPGTVERDERTGTGERRG
ncbi:MAG: SufB/SufD family protein [Acidimicrobiales bacterium]